jgi:DNA repair exonuclease SbcCD nuclease subunit
MTRFLYITDTHLGGSTISYKQQIAYREILSDLLMLLNKKMIKLGDIDFVINGGDIIDRYDESFLIKARQFFHMSKPVYFCLGNHDLTTPDASKGWLEKAPDFFNDKSLHFELETKDCILHILPNHWCEQEYFWRKDQEPYFSPEQLERLTEKLENSDLPHIIITHANIIGISQEQTGFDEEYHTQNETFIKAFTKLIDSFPQIKCILCAHNHINSINMLKNVPVISTSSFTESPFEFKFFEINNGILSIKTLNIFSDLPSKVDYDFNKTFVQGRNKDRNITIELK